MFRYFSVLFFVAAVAIPVISFAQSNFSAEMQMMNSAKKHDAFIERFAKLARDKNEKEVFAALDPASIKGANESQLLDALNKEVFPFFADFEKMKNYDQITKAQVPDGRVGLWHYTYIVDSQGNTKPFQIAVIDTEAGPKVLSILVGQCVKERHPRIPPCQ